MDLKALARKLEAAFAANPATADARVFRMRRVGDHVYPYVVSRGFTPFYERTMDNQLMAEAALERADLTPDERNALGLIDAMTPREARGQVREWREKRAERQAWRAARQAATPRSEPAA